LGRKRNDQAVGRRLKENFFLDSKLHHAIIKFKFVDKKKGGQKTTSLLLNLELNSY